MRRPSAWAATQEVTPQPRIRLHTRKIFSEFSFILVTSVPERGESMSLKYFIDEYEAQRIKGKPHFSRSNNFITVLLY